MIHIVDVRNSHHDVYIGRGSRLGNPYRIGSDGDRNTVIAKYKQYNWGKWTAGDEDVTSAISDIMELEEYRVVLLGCHCAPLACHGNVIQAMIEYIRSVT